MTTKGLLRSQVVTVASPGAYSGKPRPAVVAQANRWLPGHQPMLGNGLHKPSQLMIDKLFTVPMAAIGEVIGVLEPAAMANLDLALRGWLELG